MKPTSNDVVKGRGVPIQNLPGNKFFRQVVAGRKEQYAMMKKNADKEAIAIQVLKTIHCQKPPGRFLGQKEDGSYYELDRDAAIAKIKQALREDKPKSGESKPRKSDPSSTKTSKKPCAKKPLAKTSNKNYDKRDMDRVLELLMKDD